MNLKNIYIQASSYWGEEGAIVILVGIITIISYTPIGYYILKAPLALSMFGSSISQLVFEMAEWFQR